MKILLDILNFDFENYDLSDYLKSIKENFPLSEIYVKEKNRINIDLLKYYNIKDYNNNCDILIFFKNNEKSHNPQTTKFKFNFYFDLSYPWWSYRLRTNNDESHDLIDPDQKQTVFGRLGNRNSDEIFYFPYSFLFRCSGLGPIDKYGFRKKKHSFNSKNIMIFGGSACWGYNVLQSESFPELLEEKLNKNSQNQNFKIFNFAQHSYLLNDQFIAFKITLS